MSTALDQLIAQGMPDTIVSGFQKGIAFGDALYSNAIKLQQARQELELSARRQDLAELAQQQGYQIQSGQLGIQQSQLRMQQELQPYVVAGQNNANQMSALNIKNQILTNDVNAKFLGRVTDELDLLGQPLSLGDEELLLFDTPGVSGDMVDPNSVISNQNQQYSEQQKNIAPIKEKIKAEANVDLSQYKYLDKLVTRQTEKVGNIAAENFKRAVNKVKTSNGGQINEQDLIIAFADESDKYQQNRLTLGGKNNVDRSATQDAQALLKIMQKDQLLNGRTSAVALNDNLEKLKTNLPIYGALADASPAGQTLVASANAVGSRLSAQIRNDPDATREFVRREAVSQAVKLPPEQRQAAIDKVLGMSDFLRKERGNGFMEPADIANAIQAESQAKSSTGQLIVYETTDENGDPIKGTTKLSAGDVLLENKKTGKFVVKQQKLDNYLEKDLSQRGQLMPRLSGLLSDIEKLKADPQAKNENKDWFNVQKTRLLNNYFAIKPEEITSLVTAGSIGALTEYIQSKSGLTVSDKERAALVQVVGAVGVGDFEAKVREFTRTVAGEYKNKYTEAAEGTVNIPAQFGKYNEIAAALTEANGGDRMTQAMAQAAESGSNVLVVPDSIVKKDASGNITNPDEVSKYVKDNYAGQTEWVAGGKRRSFKIIPKNK